jgi:RNA polymerase sigma-70 factor (ECF subfamily)
MKVTSKAATLALDPSAIRESDAPWTDAARRVLTDELPEVDWDAQMRKHGRRVVVSLLARGVAPERAKELAQEAWLRVIQSHRRGRLTELKLPALVVTQAQFLALDERRRSEHRYAYEAVDDETHGPLVGDTRRLEGQLEARQQLRKIEAVVNRSHINAQRVFALLYGGSGLSAAEIASQLGISEQRVRQITCELRARIRRELGGGRRG